MKIIAFTGFAKSGKTTACEYLQNKIDEECDFQLYMSQRYSFAAPLRRIADSIYPDVDFYDSSVKEKVNDNIGKSPREILQLLGTDVARKIHLSTWTDMAKREILSTMNDGLTESIVLIDDMRFPNEYEVLQQLEDTEGEISFFPCALYRSEVSPEISEELHESERRIVEVCKRTSYTIVNNGTLEQYYSQLEGFWHYVDRQS